MVRLGSVLALLLVWSAAQTVLAQDPVKVNPKIYTVVLENDQVRVLRVNIGPGEKSVMHDHPNHIIIPLDNAVVRFGTPDGKTADATLKAGEPVWAAATKHSGESLSKTAARVIIVELKGKGGKD